MLATIPLEYRCGNCHVAYGHSAPSVCPRCKWQRFELYRPWRIIVSVPRIALASGIIAGYLLAFNPWSNPDYGPLWLALSGEFRLAWFGVLLSCVLVPGILAPVFVTHRLSFAISAISLAIWWGICVWLKAVALA